MNKLYVSIAAVILCVSFIPIRDAQSPKNSLHVLSTMGRRAYLSFNDGIGTSYSRVTKFGFNKDIDSASPEIITSFGGSFIQKNLSAETLSVVSTSANDSLGGTGARQILIQCIGSDGLQSNVPLSLNGTTPVITTSTCKFVNRVVVFSAGSGETNLGTINITQSSSGIQLAQIPLEKSTTQQLLYYVPSDRRCYLEDIYIKARKTSGGSSPRVQFEILIYSNSQKVLYDIREYFVDTSVSTFIEQKNFKAEQLRPNEIFAIRATTNTNDTIVTASFDLTCRIDDN